MSMLYGIMLDDLGQPFGIGYKGQCILHVKDSKTTMAGILAVVDALNRDYNRINRKENEHDSEM